MDTIKDLGEFGLIEHLTKSIKLNPEVIGAGDDCAILPASFLGFSGPGYLIVTTDSLVENRHFKWEYTTAYNLGWKILAVSLSDLAAMGGTPKAAVIALHLKKDFSLQVIEEIYQGIKELASQYQLQIVGGDTVQAEENSFSLTALGFSEKLPIRRNGAQAGDELWASGEIGGALGGFKILESGISNSNIINKESLLDAYNKPSPKIELGKFLLENNLATSMIDLSDGLFQDAGHLAKQSKVKIVIDLKKVPFAAGLKELNISRQEAASFGDDYQLLFTSNKANHSFLLKKASKIGEVMPEEKSGGGSVYFKDESDILISLDPIVGSKSKVGFQHFR